MTPFIIEPMINIPHNYAPLESHFHKNVIVHRKGERESFQSCSHGAGRKMGRKQAQRQLDLKHEQKLLEDQGILHSIHKKRDLDEASGAYKDIDEVIENQLDLIEVLVELRPLAVIKG